MRKRIGKFSAVSDCEWAPISTACLSTSVSRTVESATASNTSSLAHSNIHPHTVPLGRSVSANWLRGLNNQVVYDTTERAPEQRPGMVRPAAPEERTVCVGVCVRVCVRVRERERERERESFPEFLSVSLCVCNTCRRTERHTNV